MKFIRLPRLLDGVELRLSLDDPRDDVIGFAGKEPFVLSRLQYDRIVPLLDGQHSIDRISTLVKGQVSATAIVALVQMMAAHGAVVDAALSTPHAPGNVAVQVIGRSVDSTPDDALRRAGLVIADTAEAADLLVVVTDHYLQAVIAELQERTSKPLLLVRPDGEQTWIGPLIVPGQTACWECLAQRLRFNHKAEQYVARESGILPVPHTGQTLRSAGAREVAYALAAEQARLWLTTGQSTLLNALITVDPLSLDNRRHVVVRRPQCPACGQPIPSDQPPLPALQPRPIRTATAADREASAQQLFDRYAHHISPITGLVPRLVDQSRVPGLHVFAGGPYATNLPGSRRDLLRSMRFRAAGKGLTAATARASAMAETLEWYTLSAQEPSTLVTDSYERLRQRARVIAPPEVVHFSAAQYAARETINAHYAEPKYHVPQRFDPSATTTWRETWSLTRRERVFVPAACCGAIRSDFVPANSTGGAAGATIEDAIVHAALEAIERDAIALWWYNFAHRPAVDPTGVDPAFLATMRERYHRIGYDFWLLNITTDVEIPAMVAVSIANGQQNGRPVMGFGADFDPLVAATRALTELNQLHPHITTLVERDGRERMPDSDVPLPRHIFPHPDVPAVAIGDPVEGGGRDSIGMLGRIARSPGAGAAGGRSDAARCRAAGGQDDRAGVAECLSRVGAGPPARRSLGVGLDHGAGERIGNESVASALLNDRIRSGVQPASPFHPRDTPDGSIWACTFARIGQLLAAKLASRRVRCGMVERTGRIATWGMRRRRPKVWKSMRSRS